MKGLGLLTTAVFLFYGILHVDANANGAPPESCNKLDVLHFDPVESQRKGELTYYEPQKQSASVAELRSPYVIPILRTDSSTEYTASSILRVQLLRNPVYTNGDRVDFKGVIIQMRGDLDGTGQTYMPVGEFQLDDTIATNRQLGYDFSSSFKHLSCPICNVTKAFPELGSCPPGFAQNGDNTVTHTGNVGVTKSVTAQAGPTFMWTPKTDDGIWDPTRGYGRIQAQATVVKDEETFWVSLLSGRQTYENICNNVNCGTNAICELLQGGLRTRCVCNPGFFGDDCQYHCIFQPPVCQHSGQCNLDLATRDTQPCSNCPNRATGPLCGSYINCPDAVLPAVLRNQNSGSTTVGWDTPVMVGFAVANPFYFYERDGGIPLSTAQVPGSNPPRTEAQFDFGRTTVTVTGTDGSLSVFCTFSVDVVDPCLPTNPCQNNGVCIGVTTTSFFCDCSNTGYQGDTCVVDACLGQCSATQQCIKDPVTGNFIRCADGCTPDPCNGNGACESGNGGFGFVCNCNPGWTGNTCSTPTGCNANPCEALGTQTQICIPVGPTGFNCICDSDWIGTRCQFRDPCRANLGPAGVSNTCNPGQCIFNANEPYPFSPEFANFDCNCDNTGRTGPFCETSACNPPCINGNCQQDANNNNVCVCQTGYTGPDCSIPLCTPPCQMGQCVPGPSCQCDPGYSGIDCSIPGGCNTSPCQNGGFCQPIGQSGYQCFCLNPFSGQNCEIRDECQTTFCQNGGTCNTDASGAFTTCTDCNIGYSGTLCEVFNPCTPTLHQCQNGVCLPNLGSVPPYICVCNAGGWHGQFCDRAPTGCADTPCNNGGVCTTVGTNEFQCDCINNYFGDTCEYRDICLFGNINCLNGGRCQSDPTTGVFVTCEPCNTGYSGTFCENDICNNNQCLNGLCIRTGSTTYSCQCNPGWLGQYCDQPLQAGCMPDPCLNGGVCTPVGTADYRCTCPDDYYGLRCETRDGCNSVTCENGGRCTVNPVTGAFMGCVDCDLGYSGLYCQLYVCDYQFCANGGRCIPLSASDYRCECPPQWIGQFCERPTACESPNPCENGGTCTATATGSFVCMCILSLWTGPTCEIPVACQPGGQNPCQNGGTCRPTSGSDYRCDCPPAWTGDYCQIAVVCLDPSKCRNGGTCTYDIYGVFTGCSCRPGYFGDSCELDGCFGSPCGDYGYCRAVNNQVGFICECFNFYSGPNCEIPPVCGVGFANDPCQPNGICEEDFSSARGYRCNCYPGYSGPQCLNEDACYNNPCQNGGQCTTDGLGSFTCECYSGYTGVYCQIRPVCGNNPCYNGGICIPNSDSVFEYDCNCIGPYTGQRCEILSGCNNNPCLNGGLCIPDENGGYRCNCVNDYTGRHCSIEPVCTTNPCYNGNCVPSNGVPTCICWDGYYGPYCDKRNECYNNNPCLNEGVCYFDEEDGRAKCDCTDLFSGYFCEIPNFRLCDINICLNGGTCWDEPDRGSVCTCINGYGGDLCEHIIISCEERYCDNGYCIEADFARGKTSRCRCNNGWYGEQCSERFENPCARGPCQNGGQCEYYSQYGGAYICKCAKGYSGKDCQNRGDIPRAAATRLQMVSLWTLITALGFYLLSRS